MVFLNKNVLYTRKGGLGLTYIPSHLLSQLSVPFVSVCMSVLAEGIVYDFIQHAIYHSLVQQLGAESDRTRQKDKRSTRVWEFRDKNQ